MKRNRVAAALVAIQILLVAVAPAWAQEDTPIDCSQTSVGMSPLTDLGTGTYQGEQGGLYPGGSNEVPADHEALGLFRAAQIEPRDAAGEPDPAGTIVLLSIGVSNTRTEWRVFMRDAGSAASSNVTTVNGSQPGEDISMWQDPESHTWQGIETILGNNGVTPEQVQAVWIMLPDTVNDPATILTFPEDAAQYRDQLATVVRNAMDHYPNLQVAYLSSRIYAGYNTSGRPSPEPLAYENAFGVKWLIADQIAGDMSLNADERRGDVVAPWLVWGPYLWADGLTPRSDGLIWECRDFQDDGIHPSQSGAAKVSDMLIEYFSAAPTTAPWFTGVGAPIGEVTLPPVVAGVTTTTAATETTTTVTTTTTSGATTTTRDFTSPDRPGAPDRATREEERAARAATRAESGSDVGWLVGTVAVLALVLGAVAAFGYMRRRDRVDESIVEEPDEESAASSTHDGS